MDLPLGIILDTDWGARLFVCGEGWNEIEHEFIINFKIRNSDCIFVIKTASNLLENLSDGSGNETSVLIVLHASTHGKGLSSTSLSIHHDGPIEPIYHWFYYIFCTGVEYIILRGVMKKFIEFEAPGFLLVIYETTTLILWDIHIYMLI